MIHTPRIWRALEFATKAHQGQVRKYTNLPYVVHPIRVANIVQSAPGVEGHPVSESMLVAAILHDTVEDTETTLEDILRHFGGLVMEFVTPLTDVSRPSDGNRSCRKALDRTRLANTCREVQTIKVADLIDNTSDIVAFDKAFAKVYLKEKRLLLDVLTKANPVLAKRARAQLEVAGGYYISKTWPRTADSVKPGDAD